MFHDWTRDHTTPWQGGIRLADGIRVVVVEDAHVGTGIELVHWHVPAAGIESRVNHGLVQRREIARDHWVDRRIAGKS